MCFRALFVVNPVVKPEYFIFYGEIWDPEPWGSFVKFKTVLWLEMHISMVGGGGQVYSRNLYNHFGIYGSDVSI